MDERITETVQTYNDFASTYVAYNASVEPIREQIETFLRHLDGKRVLDVGCGPGRDSLFFSERGLNVIGVDLTARFVQMAKENAPDAAFCLADMRHLPFLAGGFDGLWACASLLHIPHKEVAAVAAGFRRLLKPDGLLFVDIKQGEGEEMVRASHFENRKRFFSYYTSESLRDLLLNAGFTVFEEMINAEERDVWLSVFARAV